jgi:hypothetical protein
MENDMSESIDFVLHDKIDGVEVTPSTIDFTRFNEFNQQVEEFVAGSDARGVGRRLQLDTVHVQIVAGSYCLRVLLTSALLAAVEPELKALTNENALSSIDDRRAKVVERWQSKAKMHDDRWYEVRVTRSDGRATAPVIRIGPETNFRRDGMEPWVQLETYLLGDVYDMGGERPNVHIKIPESGETHIIQADRDTLKGMDKGVLYERSLLHVRGEQNIATGQLRKLQLLEFVNYNPNYDAAALDRFIAEGREAWADVPDAATWVRDLRGD